MRFNCVFLWGVAGPVTLDPLCESHCADFNFTKIFGAIRAEYQPGVLSAELHSRLL